MYAYLMSWLALKSDRRAVTALEYGLIAALIAGAVIAGATTVGGQISSIFTKLGADMTTANATFK